MDLFITIALLSSWVKYLHFFERTGEMKMDILLFNRYRPDGPEK